MLLSPVLLVRLLSVEAYGQYREFILYAMTMALFFRFAIPSSLTYLIPTYPDRQRSVVTQTIFLILAVTLFGIIGAILFRSQVMAVASYDFFVPLLLYVFFFVNFDILETYWIGRGEARKILVYAPLVTMIRVFAMISAVLALDDIVEILYVLVVVEALRALAVGSWLAYRRLWSAADFSSQLLREQLTYVVPLGMASILFFLNQRFGQWYIAGTIGATSLAVYTIGTYQLPLATIVRSAVADALFPDMVRRVQAAHREGLELWKKATVCYCSIGLPAFFILFWYADEFVTLLFTSEYIQAANIFRVALFIMVRQCFDMGMPLRAQNANRHTLVGNIGSLFLNVPITLALVPSIGIVGAAVGLVVGDLVLASYSARRILDVYGLRFREMARWGAIGRVLLAAACSAALMAAWDVSGVIGGWLQDLLGIALFTVTYLIFLHRLQIPEINVLRDYMVQAVSRRVSAR